MPGSIFSKSCRPYRTTSGLFRALLPASAAIVLFALAQPASADVATQSVTEQANQNLMRITLQETPQSLPGRDPSYRIAQVERRKRRRKRTRRTRRRDRKPSASSAYMGRYGILRKNNKDVGCVLSLRRNGRAQLGPGCGDQGIVIFDPRGWRVRGDSMTLRARAGHRISFTRKADGIWYRSPAGKRPLSLKKY